MSTLTVFEALVITHFVMEWLFQTKWEALNKTKKLLPLLTHCLIYTAGFIPVFLWYGGSFLWLGVIFLSHLILDQRSFEFWWIEKIKRFKLEDESEVYRWVIVIGLDQTFHIVILAIVTLLG